MADLMFGTPSGTRAAEKDMRENLLGGLNAQKLIGEIGMQPLEADLIKTRARLYTSQAAEHEAKTREMLTFQQLAQRVGKEPVAPQESPSTPLRKLGLLAVEGGFVERGAKILKDAALIDKRESDIEKNNSQKELRDSTIQVRRNERIGSLAGAALQGDQANYDAVRMAAAAEGFPVEDLPARLEDAKPELRRIFLASMKANEQLRAQQTEKELKVRERRAAAAESNAAARRRVAEADVKLKKARVNKLNKDMGPKSPEAVRAMEALVKARETAAAVREAKLYPIPTPDELANNGKGLRQGQVYTTPRGRLMWNGTGFVPPPPGTPAAKPASTRSVDPEADDDDDEDDDD